MSRYEIRDDGTGTRWDWLNVPLARFPYLVYEWREDTLIKWWFVELSATMRGAKRAMRRRSQGTRVVYRESEGQPVLPDLREWALVHDGSP